MQGDLDLGGHQLTIDRIVEFSRVKTIFFKWAILRNAPRKLEWTLFTNMALILNMQFACLSVTEE
jgi:hypothetical protein